MLGVTICSNPSAAGYGVYVTVELTHGIEHHLRAVFELKTEPVPAYLIGRHLVARPLVIKPTVSMHIVLWRVFAQGQGAGCLKAGERIVMGGVAQSRCFLAYAIGSFDDRWFEGGYLQVNGHRGFAANLSRDFPGAIGLRFE